jgi:hypothetical protein
VINNAFTKVQVLAGAVVDIGKRITQTVKQILTGAIIEILTGAIE